MVTAELNQVLNVLDFNSKSVSSTLFYTSQDYTPDQLLFEERLVLDFARKIKVTAVYFRRFGENRSSLPQLFIFDNTTGQFSEKELAEIHRKLWSSGIVPLYYVFDNVNINIYDARKQVDYDQKTQSIQVNCFESLPIVAKTQKHLNYSAKLFANGSFWDQKETANHFLSKESAENKLIEGLKQIRTRFIHDTKLEKNLAHQLIVLSILVKYLEERKDEQGNHVFPSDYFNKYEGSNSFCDVLRKGKIVDLFGDLSGHFNGKIFALNTVDEEVLKNTDLSKLAQYLDANVDKDHFVIWPLYSFEYLPVELISRIYEEFIPERNDAVYTPIHLARFMVDECMPISEPKTDFKAIDVSCGSGVFLVTVFKRLVQWWQKEQFDRTGKLINPEIDVLKQILLNSIYGVDIEADSVRLSVFSLSIALCDMLKPTEIWTKLRFDDLRQRNIYEGDFFQYLKDSEKGQFDLVIGNPPFEDKMKDFKKLYSDYGIDKDYHIPRHQIAMLFLQQAMKLLKPSGLLSFVMPSGPLLYNNTIDFRKKFFSTYEVAQIVDLSELRNASLLFERTISTAVIFAYNQKPAANHNILHITIKRSKTIREKLFFEVDHYDMHQVPQKIAETDLDIWKSNLLGGNQLYYLVNRFRKLRTLGEYLEEKRKTSGWVFGEGYIIAGKTEEGDHLTGQLLIETEDFIEDGFVKLSVETGKWFQRSRNSIKQIFKAPHLLIKEVLGLKKFVLKYVDIDLVFKHRIIGIHCPKIQEQELLRIEDTLLNNYQLFKLLILASSAEAGINRSGGYIVLKKDFWGLPYPENVDLLELSINEEIIKDDVLNYKLEELSKGENAKINTTIASERQLDEFGQVLCDSLNAIYQQNGKSFNPMEPIKTLSYTCFPFSYGNAGFNPVLASKIQEGDLSDLIENEQESVHYRRVLRLYQKDMVFLIKPNTLRYWLKSIALRDASDVMVDLINSGY
ncbi:MAG: hypothetical protein A2066_02510 [Bacteroidetes bacterium GWB2_41_8]|nr:MAG: hypothetical protein A2066_02510 [Bacteroidetes bacterium GWB2_41_8]